MTDEYPHLVALVPTIPLIRGEGVTGHLGSSIMHHASYRKGMKGVQAMMNVSRWNDSVG